MRFVVSSKFSPVYDVVGEVDFPSYRFFIVCGKHKDIVVVVFYMEVCCIKNSAMQSFINSWLFMFESYLYLNIKTYKTRIPNA